MYRYWVTLLDGTYGYLWADAKPLPGDRVTIFVILEDEERIKVTGQVSKVS